MSNIRLSKKAEALRDFFLSPQRDQSPLPSHSVHISCLSAVLQEKVGKGVQKRW